MLDEKTIRDDIERASLPPHVHNNFRDYLAGLSTVKTTEDDFAHVEEIVVRTSLIVTDEDVANDPSLALGSRLVFNHIVPRHEKKRWDTMVDLVTRSIMSHDADAFVDAVRIDGETTLISRTIHDVVSMWSALHDISPMPRELWNIYATPLDPRAGVNRLVAEIGHNTILDDRLLLTVRVMLGLDPQGRFEWRSRDS